MAEQRTIEDMREVLDRVKYKDWKLVLEKRQCHIEGPLQSSVETYDVALQVQFMAVDSNEGGDELVLQKGRKWFLSRYSCDTEIIQTAWAAVHRAELHEIQEEFLYRGVSIWNNHVDVDALVEVANRIDQRDSG